MNTTTPSNSHSLQASKAITQAKKDKGKKRNGGGANRSKAIHLRNINVDLQDVGTDLVLGVITKKLANTRFQVTIPDPADAFMADASGLTLTSKPLNKQKLIDVQAAALDKKAQRSLHSRENNAEPGAFVAVCKSGRNFEIQLLLDKDTVRAFKNQGRIHPKLVGASDESDDCGIEFDYEVSEQGAADALVAALTTHKNKNFARGIHVEKPLVIPLKPTTMDSLATVTESKEEDTVLIDDI